MIRIANSITKKLNGKVIYIQSTFDEDKGYQELNEKIE